jgi:glyoxalase family protein
VIVDDSGDPPLVAKHPDIPAELALRGFAGVRAYASAPERSAPFLSALGFRPEWESRGALRGGFYVYDEPPGERGLSGAGAVHHVAWACPLGEEEAWRARVREAGGQPTPVIDRFYFRSVYFREPSGVLFEIATIGPGFTADEPFETLGESLSLPPNYEQYRAQVEQILTPLPSPRRDRARAAGGG